MLPTNADKDILFLIDISGSMSGRPLTNAIANARNVFDKYTNDDDHVGFATFDNHFYVMFNLKPRCKVKRRDFQCEIKGGTAFYDALIKAVDFSTESSNSYLVALTDGADYASRHSIEDTHRR